jgi:peptide-methionine (S)-S-oxide reductase
VKARRHAALALLLFWPFAARAAEEIAIFAGGCFWCMEPPFESLAGVKSVTSGYTGGTKQDPSYEEVSAGGTGHAEAVQVVFDPARVSYEKLLDVFWHNIDPTVAGRQFCDVGDSYRSAIFVRDAAQRRAAEASLAAVQAQLGVPVKTQIADASAFYPAEGYHQDYAKKNPVRYRYYRWGCGRDARLAEIWGKDAPAH